jgi:hypothetical protein
MTELLCLPVSVALAREPIEPVEVEAVIVELAELLPEEPPNSLETIDFKLEDLEIVPASMRRV